MSIEYFSKTMAWLRLIRWKNLLIIFLTQLLAWWCIILFEEPRVLDIPQFSMLSLSTILIAAAGYIINDYFDIKIDMVNKPGKVVLEYAIPRKQAIIAHSMLNAAALCLAACVAIPAHHPEWLLLQVGCTLLLWFYSTKFKRQYITGNVVVAFLASLTILVLVVYEPILQIEIHFPLVKKTIGNYPTSLPVWILAAYAYFAFMLTWMREIVKDMEDIKGDAAEGCITMPIKKGLEFSRHFTTALSLLAIVPICIASFVLFTHNYGPMSLYVAVLALSISTWTVFLLRGHSERHYHLASRYLKFIMLLGIGSFIVYYLQLYPNYAT